MGIKKQGKNIDIKVDNKYTLFVGGKMEKIATKINVEAYKENLSLISNKKIISKGKVEE